MRNLLIISAFICLVCPGALLAQNVPVLHPAGLEAPIVSVVDLPVDYVVPATGLNLTRIFVPWRKITSTGDGNFNLNPSSATNSVCKVVTNYVNGWGSTIETISRGGYGHKDIVAASDLRASLTGTSFLPHVVDEGSQFQTTPFVDQQAYYAGLYPDEGNMSYSQQVTSYPADVPTETSYSPGASFVGHGVGTTVTHRIGDGTEGIII